jgi:6-phosphogluconolactonase (cycloisomerase 2 family)
LNQTGGGENNEDEPTEHSVLAVCHKRMGASDVRLYQNNGNVNSVSAFRVGANGALKPVPGSPFSAGGTGGASVSASTQITSTVAKNFLYVTNTKSATIAAFSIDAHSGKQKPVPGSPFSTGFSDIGGLAITPDDKFLVITSGSGASIAVNAVGADGTPTPVAGSPFRGPIQLCCGTANPKVTPDGKFLAISSVTDIGAGVISMFTISAAGAVSHVSRSNAGAATGIDCNCASNHLYTGSDFVKLVNGMSVSNPVEDAFSIGPTGVLAPLAGSPFFGPGGLDVLLSPNGHELFASGVSSGISVFDVAPDGSLSPIPGSPFQQGLSTVSIAVNDSGSSIYSADMTSHSIDAFHIATNGALTPVPGSPFPSGALDGPLGVTMDPPKTCCPAPKVSEVSASPSLLWPPDSRLVPVSIDYRATGEMSDVGDDSPAQSQTLARPNTCVLTVSSNEPPSGATSGNRPTGRSSTPIMSSCGRNERGTAMVESTPSPSPVRTTPTGCLQAAP